ncbi:MAG: adenylate/guanylate cyclase domain-containing protein [Candidatus Rifleibacteriota bacterium]
MTGKFTRKFNRNISDNGKRAFLVLLPILFISFLPFVNNLFSWLDAKVVDLFFALKPYTDQTAPNHTALTIVKDQTFFKRFGRDPDRRDFARLVNHLKEADVKLVAFDFIFSSATDPEKDKSLVNALDEFPYTLVAQHFVSRGRQTFETDNLYDNQAFRPPWPVKLWPPLAKAVSLKGLINLVADFDSTVRYAPIAFHPTEMSEFLPSFAYAAYIARLFSDSTENLDLNSIQPDFSNCENTLLQTINQGPFKFNSSGHKGIDIMTRRLEIKLLADYLARFNPQKKSRLEAAAQNLNLSLLNKSTWLELPSDALPLTGNYDMPCIRLNFYKSQPPQKSDTIKNLSMSLLLKTKEDQKWANRLYKYDLNIKESQAKIPLAFNWQAPGESKITGNVEFFNNRKTENLVVRLEMSDGAYWDIVKTDETGKFIFDKVPAGNFIITVINKTSNGYSKSSLSGKSEPGRIINLPKLYGFSPDYKVNFKDKLPPETDEIFIFGEPLHLIKTDKKGLCNASLPDEFELFCLDENIENFKINDGIFTDSNGEALTEKVFAAIKTDPLWNHEFLFKFKPGQKIKVPSTINSQLILFSDKTGNSKQKTTELTVYPETDNLVTEVPELTHKEKQKIRAGFKHKNPLNELFAISETENRIKLTTDSEILLEPGKYNFFATKGKLRGKFNRLKAQIGNRTPFIGTSLAEDQDFITTPINFLDSSFNRLPGVNLHANLFSALMRNDFLKPLFIHSDYMPYSWPLWQVLAILPFLLICNFIFFKLGALWGGFAIVLTACAWFSTAFFCFLYSMLLPVFIPVVSIASFGISRGYIAWAISKRKEQETRSTFGRFISSAVVEDILKTPESLKPGGEKKELTIMFSDLAGFTTISEKLPPEQLTELMNEYLGEMTKLLFDYRGTLDKYIGDAIMAFWNHPKEQADHPELAARCAIAMQKKLIELRQKWKKHGLPEVQVRVGLNTANSMVGFIGSDIQMNFTCLGDGVNLASRLEGANKPYNTLMMISESVYKRLNPEVFSTRFLDYLAVKGKKQPIKVYELRGYLSEEKEEWLKAEKFYNKGIESYLNRDWNKAIELFEKVLKFVPQDSPTRIFIERSLAFKKNPPPEDWDGRFILTSK